MAIEHLAGGGTIFTGEDTHKFRIITLATAMHLELKGIRVKPWSVTASVKREFGLRGSNRSVYEQFCRMHNMEPRS